MGRIVRRVVDVRDQEADLVPVDETDAAIGCAERTSTDPHDLATRAQLVEVAAAIAVDPCGQHIALDHRSRNRCSLHLGNRFGYGIDAPTPRAGPLPCWQEPSERVALDRFDLASKRRQRAAPQLAKHIVITELPLSAAGPELPPQEVAVRDEPFERAGRTGLRNTQPTGDIAGVERAVGPGVTTTQVTEWVIDRIGKHRRQTDRKRHPYSIAKAGRVVAGSESIVVRDAHLDRSALFQQRTHPGLDRCPVDRTSLKIEAVERPEPSQHIVKLIGVACPAAIDQQLEFELEVSEHLGVEQLTKLLRAEHVAQQLPIERQRRCTALGDRGVAFVHVDGDPREQQRLRKGRRLIGVDRHHAHLAAPQIRHHRTQRRQVEHVVDALAGGFEQHWEGRILGGHVEQIGGPLTLLPQRRALIGPTTWQQQCPG